LYTKKRLDAEANSTKGMKQTCTKVVAEEGEGELNLLMNFNCECFERHHNEKKFSNIYTRNSIVKVSQII
jgi:hypothetical protein